MALQVHICTPYAHAMHMHMHSACTFTPHSLCRRIPEGSWVLQEYAMNIMTYDGNKFDLRVWAAVTSLDPLRIYLLGTGIPKVPHMHAHAHTHALLLRVLLPLLPSSDLTVEVLQGTRARQGAMHPRAAARHGRVLHLELAAGQRAQPLPT